ncbi:MAG: hypothetical protein LBI48_03600 [Burkholderiaceae bacterium]|nr:hypothetical protein [Burkholderiaceae bacterium]
MHPAIAQPAAEQSCWALLAPLALMAGYCLGVQALMLYAPHHPLTILAVLGPGLLGAGSALWNARRRALALLVLAAGGGALGWLMRGGLADVRPLYVAEYVTAYSALAWLFGRTLRAGGTPLITQLARAMHLRGTPELERYTAKVTRAWVLYFIGMALVCVLLFALLPFGWWALYANIISPLALGGFFLGEYLLRYRWHPEFERASILDTARAWRQRGQG